jgi:hypothetical protein
MKNKIIPFSKLPWLKAKLDAENAHVNFYVLSCASKSCAE